MSEAVVAAAREDFGNRIGAMVRSMSKAGPMTDAEWWLISREFLDYLGALSVETPDLGTPEAKAALEDAAEAAAGAVAYAAYYPLTSFQVFLNYLNFGIGYERESEGRRTSITADQWLDAFCLAVLAGKVERHGEAFHFARQAPQRGGAGRPAVELINGLMAYVIGDTGDDQAACPPSGEQQLAAIDAALGRVRALAGELDANLVDHPHSIALHALRALAGEDLETFRADLVKLLLPHSASAPGARPRTLLPLLPLALAALARHRHSWTPLIDTGYLPRALVTRFEVLGPRVGEYGRNRRPDAVAELADGPVPVKRPGSPQPLDAESEALFEQYTREALTGNSAEAWGLWQAMGHQGRLFQARAALSGDVTDPQRENLRLASQLGAALFRAALAEPGTGVEVTIDDRAFTVPADDDTEPGHWHAAMTFALITGTRADLAPVVLAGPVALRNDTSAFASYRRALHDYLRGIDPEPATDRALHDCEKAKNWGFFPPPAVLLSQLVEGDEESFNLALLDALEAHRDHYSVADRADDPKAAINLDILALACHARRRGWTIHVTSPYLPAGLLAGG
ncbi:immunity 49 family protein [Nonomuraea zeae]|uniref:Immunity 49 family protein n=1 Tax=Nonomuraea zeae TaxID=1642303 RepID=A0A5S4GEV8_9ACTN|nr:immunity 49 family protein [Nonomuraea zeae]TMR24650.1 hypothetical protein ETD85_46310 [Nonomuraea zeae]